MLNLPPDRTMYGRSFWTYMHTLSVYLQHNPSADQMEAFKGARPRTAPLLSSAFKAAR